MIVAQEELEKREKEKQEAKKKRKLEEENQELLKKKQKEQEEIELREKVEKNLLAKSLEEEKANRQDEPIEEFELRKDTLPKSENQNISSPEANADKSAQPGGLPNPHVMPRAVLLSNAQLQQQLQAQKARLYDDEEEGTQMSQEQNDSYNSNDLKTYSCNDEGKKEDNAIEDDEDTGEIIEDELEQYTKRSVNRDDLSSGEISGDNSNSNLNERD